MSHKLNQIFSALADPTRRNILMMLLEDDMAVTDIADPFDMSLAAISKHLIVLTNAGLISQERRGRVKWCKLDTEAMNAAFVWIQSFGQLDPINLDSLEEFLAKERLLKQSDLI
jgi:DNA-binding transcriptional ArsR family regulator